MNKEDILEEFSEKIDKELSVRKKNLQDMKILINSTENLNNKFLLMRSFYPALYAHYEGFLKSNFFNLIESLESLNIDFYDIKPNLILLCILPNLENHLVKQEKKAEKLLSLFNNVFINNKNIFESMNKDKYVINHDTIKSTLSLLDIDLNSINYPLEELGIIYDRRNGIAHGELNPNGFNIFNISSPKELTESRVNNALKFWNEDFDEVCNSLEIIKAIFYDYLNEEKYLKVNTNINNIEIQTNDITTITANNN